MTLKSLLTGKFDPKDFADKQGETWVVIPSVFYPAMIAHIKKSLENEDIPQELVDKDPHPEIDPRTAARRYRNWAKRIGPQAWTDAHRSLIEIPADDERKWVLRVTQRAEALECARLWFTRALKNGAEGMTRIRILNDSRFKLGVNLEFRAG